MTGSLWKSAYIGIGSNLLIPQRQVCAAFDALHAIPGIRVEARSSLYRSRPMGPQNQPEFINAVAGILTVLDARALLDALLALERRMGRERRERWGARVIDLDLLWIAGAVIDAPDLTVPHPGVSDRNFVLYPLAEIAPDLKIPGIGHVSVLKARVDPAGIATAAFS